MSSLYGNDRRKSHAARDDWFSGVEGIVVETDPTTYCVKVIIPSVDEEMVFDDWVPVLTPFAGPPGYGAAFMPAPGSEVVLFSRGNEGLSLFAVSRFNEEYLPPAEAADGSHVLKTPHALKLLADLLVLIRSGQTVTVQGVSGVNADAPDVRLMSGGAVGVHAQGAKVGFMGASPVTRRPLPGPAIDPASCIALANAIRAALIALGLCE
jgi:hypothetical protein